MSVSRFKTHLLRKELDKVKRMAEITKKVNQDLYFRAKETIDSTVQELEIAIFVANEQADSSKHIEPTGVGRNQTDLFTVGSIKFY